MIKPESKTVVYHWIANAGIFLIVVILETSSKAFPELIPLAIALMASSHVGQAIAVWRRNEPNLTAIADAVANNLGAIMALERELSAHKKAHADADVITDPGSAKAAATEKPAATERPAPISLAVPVAARETIGLP